MTDGIPGKIPVTLLTGFLGAGKTSRLNATLAAGTSRVAVIENELGALGVDGLMVANTHDDGVVELNNGCLCCTAEVDIVSALEGLAQRRATRPFDRLIIETTGLADVGPVEALLRDREDPLADDFVFDAVLTVVDAASFKRWGTTPGAGPPVTWASGFGGAGVAPAGAEGGIGPGREAARTIFWKQIGLADQLLISKADLAGEAAVEELLALLTAVNPVAEQIVDWGTCPSVLPAPLGDRVKWPRPPSPDFLRPLSTKRRRRRADPHLEGVQALTLRPPPGKVLKGGLLRSLVEQCLQPGYVPPGGTGPGDIWRVKGFVAVEGVGPVLVQGVGDQVHCDPWPHALKEDQLFLVAIGEGIEQELLEAALGLCVSDLEQEQLLCGDAAVGEP